MSVLRAASHHARSCALRRVASLHPTGRSLSAQAAFSRSGAAPSSAAGASRRAWMAACGAAITAGAVIAWNAGEAQVQAESSAAAASAPLPSASAAASSLAAAHAELSALLGDRFVTDSSDLEVHGADAFSFHKNEGALPSAVAYAQSTEEVAAVVRVCAKHRVRMIPYGSGTSLEGHTTAPQGGVCIDLSRMQSIVELNEADMDVTVQAGLSWGNLNELLQPHGLFYPVDPGPGASIGGMVATSCSGTNAVRHGTMKHNVLHLTVVMPDGSVVRTGRRARKSSAGYDLTRFFIGSEGTLGIVTEACLRLQPLPETTAIARVAFPSVRLAAEATRVLLARGVRVGAVELLDSVAMQAVNANSGTSYPTAPATVFFKFTGRAACVADDVTLAGEVAQAHEGGEFVFAVEPAERERMWEARKVALWACIAYRPGCEAWTTDVCVPLSRMAECMEATRADLESLDIDEEGQVVERIPLQPSKQPSANVPAKALLAPVGSHQTAVVPAAVAGGSSSPPPSRSVSFPSAVFGHMGDGNFHTVMMLDPTSKRELALASLINDRMVRRAIAMEGTCTGEHGVGVGKKKFMAEEFGPTAMTLMRQLKKAVDPHGLMNPGKIFDLEEPAATAAAAICDETTGECKLQPRRVTAASKDTTCCGRGHA